MSARSPDHDAATGDAPNVLLIHCHDLGRYLGCYGAAIDTPRLDDLADTGVCFENHFVTAPQCSPSRGSLMTGRHPHVNGLMGLAHGSWELGEDERILPQYLGDAGYETHLFGLQHISQDTDRLQYEYVHSEGNLYPGVSPAVHEANRARNVAEVVSAFLETERFQSPFFASVGFFELHRVEDDHGRYGFDPDHYETDDPRTIRPLTYLPDRRGIRQDLAEMHGMVWAVDDAVGTILDTLDRTGLDEETVVVFTTEHGIAFPRAKGCCYDAGIEAALLIRYPGTLDGGVRIPDLVSNVDVLPTLLELVGVPVPDGLDGYSVLSTVLEACEPDGESGTASVGHEGTTRRSSGFESVDASAPHDSHRDHIFAGMTWHDMYNPVRAIRTYRYKYVRNFWHLPAVYLTADIFASEAGREVRETFGVPPRPYEELYDLAESPQEDKNVVREPRYESIRADLARRLHAWMERTDDPLLTGAVEPGDAETVYGWPHDA